MPSVYQLKSDFQRLLRPLVRRLADTGVTANQVTVFASMASIIVGGALYLVPDSRLIYLSYPLFFIVRMALNAIDGMLAKEFQQKSPLGAHLNELGDVLSDAVLFLPLAAIAGTSPVAVTSFTVLAISTEVVGLVAHQTTNCRRYDGPMGKSDRAVAIGTFMFFAAIFPGILPWLNWILVALAILCLKTIANRITKSI